MKNEFGLLFLFSFFFFWPRQQKKLNHFIFVSFVFINFLWFFMLFVYDLYSANSKPHVAAIFKVFFSILIILTWFWIVYCGKSCLILFWDNWPHVGRQLIFCIRFCSYPFLTKVGTKKKIDQSSEISNVWIGQEFDYEDVFSNKRDNIVRKS